MKTIYCCQNFKYVKYGYNSFKFNGILLWNKLSNDIKRECNFKKFRSMISKWNGPQCSCSYCKLCILNNM